MGQHEFGIVERLLGSQPIEAVIRNASQERRAAIAAHAEVLPSVLNAADPASLVAEVRNQVFDRLIDNPNK